MKRISPMPMVLFVLLGSAATLASCTRNNASEKQEAAPAPRAAAQVKPAELSTTGQGNKDAEREEELVASPEQAWKRWASREVEFYEIPKARMHNTYKLLGHMLDQVDAPKLNFIDVGCAVGDYLLRMEQLKLKKPLHSIGIDPLDLPKRSAYTKFLQVAVANLPPGEAEFNLYGGPDLATSSLSKLKKENVTHDPKKAKEKFYHPVDIETEKGKITVETVPMWYVVENEGLKEEPLHFVKIDIQGTDLAAFQSFDKYAKNVLAVQLESIYSEKEEHKLYEGQTLFKEDDEALKKLGFRIFNVARFPNGPKADVIWVNLKLLATLVPSLAPPIPQP